MKRKRLPIGISDFKTLRDNNYYYVDKTSFIQEILEKRSAATLITRPRRFGKTLNMSTLNYFLDIRNAEANRELFKGLNIEKTEYMEYQGKFPVIHLTMKDLDGEDFESFLVTFRTLLSDLFEAHKYLREKLDERNLFFFDKIWYQEENANYDTALKFLSKLLYDHYGVNPVILIDEYDSPFITANEKGYYEKVKILLGRFYGSALKDGVCSFAVITGILKVAKESIFSTLNNLQVSSILADDYNYFGMTEYEVEEVLKYYELETTLSDTQLWYNGYLFGNMKIYNPWSILSHCHSGKLEPYWVNTSANTHIKQILKDADDSIFDLFHRLLKNGSVKTNLQENIVFGEKYTDQTLFYLMFSAGYLTIEKPGEKRNEYYLTIPNYEVKEYFKETFIDLVSPQDRSKFYLLEEALTKGRVTGTDSIEEILQNMFTSSMSYLDTSKEEKFYHNLILGMIIGLDKNFYPLSNRESGFGRYDLALEPKNKNGIGYIFEFKVSKTFEEMDKIGEEAIEQIENKNYRLDMENRKIREVKEIAIVFHKKNTRLEGFQSFVYGNLDN